MRKTIFRLAAVALVAGLVTLSSDHAQTCSDTAARNLLATSIFDATVNPPDGEDQGFITRNSGIPNIFVLLDNSGSMKRLPPNGPAFYPGTLPPLHDYGCSGTGDDKDPGCTNASLNDLTTDCTSMDGCAVMGCGDDPESAKYAGTGTVIEFMTNRVFNPPCGNSLSHQTNPLDSTKWLENQVYQGDSVDYAHESSVCPYWKNPDPATGLDGFDPDHYCGSTGTNIQCSGGKPNFFDKNMVFHDAIVDAAPAGAPGDGWTDADVSPYLTSGKKIGTIDEFCTDHFGSKAMQGAVLKKDICSSCLTKRGFLLDGRLFRKNQEGLTSTPELGYPSIWLSGNFLNFYPPKFIIARKVMKDIIMAEADIRMGLAHFGTPGADHSNGEFQDLMPQCGMSDTSNFSSSRGTYIDQVDKVTFTAGTPLPRAMLDLGQYYKTPSLPWFGSTDATWNSASNANQLSICNACQVSSIVVISDGRPKQADSGNLPVGSVTASQADSLYAGDAATGIVPNASGVGGIPKSLCKRCTDFAAPLDWMNNATRVAWYLHNMDLRKTGETTEDCMGMGGKQTANIYAVGFGTQATSQFLFGTTPTAPPLPDANKLLQNVADMGGGSLEKAESPGALKDAVKSIFNRILERSTSFSVATVSTLQTTSGHSVIVPRFDPDKESTHWKGHLSRYELYSEFLNPCTETSDGSGAGDLDCDGKCQSVFLTDKAGAFISEDADGIFRKNEPNSPYCIQAPLCAAKGRPCGMPGTSEAVAWWDASTRLASAAWSARRVYTVIDRTSAGVSDGKIDGNDEVFQLEATDAVATKIRPYLGDLTVCATIGGRISANGDPDTGLRVTDEPMFCVKEIIRYLLGADVYNEKGATSGVWPQAATDAGQDALQDRDWKLGDIFHSSPVVMDPPPPADGILCPNGLHNQCLSSLWATPTPWLDPATNPYQAYATSTAYGTRRKVVLVGANDGMLHAFDGGVWHGNATPNVHNDSADDPVTAGLDESLPPFNGYYDRGSGDELWAFVAPDMLGKLQLYVKAQVHQLFVDGSPMVRDVWVDGSSNTIGSGLTDDKKQPEEFHTVAVLGERRGGTRYFALDVSDASFFASEKAGSPPKPKFLWIYPQPTDRESVTSGESYTDFLPVGPPIGPIRVEADSTSGLAVAGVTPTMIAAGVATPVPYHERWVTFLSGGFDPMYLRGRGVHMVDVWSGKELFDFSFPDGSLDPNTGGAVTSGDPRLELKYPVAATVAMVMWGQSELRKNAFENDGFFDTATFGDTGGQLWALRFSRPGRLDASTKRATNWFGGRILSMPGCANEPFFYITANVAVRQGYYRVLAGTGDRYNLLDTNGGNCDPNNPRACWQRGCSVTLLSAANSQWADGAGSVSRDFELTGSSCGTVTTASSTATPTACQAGGRVSMAIDCGGSSSTARTLSMTCALPANAAEGYTCTGTPVLGESLTPNTSITNGNWYMSLRVFDTAGSRMIFSDLAGAKSYDGARFTISSKTSATPTGPTGIVLINGADGVTPTTLATNTSAGWAMYYNHDGTVAIQDHSYTVSWLDERTTSTSAVYAGVFWNATQPTLGSADRLNESGKCSKTAKCVAEGRRVTYHYGANAETGGMVLQDPSNNLIRSVKNITLVPAMGDQPTVFVNQQGQIQVGLTSVNPERGATNVFSGESKDPVSEYGIIPVSRTEHACRHATSQAEAATACK